MNETDWAPKEEVLSNVLDVLQDSFIPDSIVQQSVQDKLTSLQSNSDLFNYFLLIFESNQMFDEKTRALSGLILKNNLTYLYESTSAQIIQNMKSKCLKLLSDPSREVRSSASAVITVIALKGGLENWPDLLPHLLAILETDNNEAMLKTLINICEDYLSQRYQISSALEDPIKKLLNKFVDLTTNSSKSVQKHSFKILNEALQKFYATIKSDFDSNGYVQRLIQSANDSDEEIIALICQAFVAYINNQDEAILPVMTDVIKYMLIKTQDENEDIALQACEFWFSIAKLQSCKELLANYLEDLCSILLKNMRYSDHEIRELKGTLEKDFNIVDRVEDTKPFGRSCEDDDDPEIGWTLRKCSAASLDSISVQFREDIVPVILPLILNCMDSEDLLTKECGILALGAIAEGCFSALSKSLMELIPKLIECMEDPRSLIRSITCWTFSRYIRFVVYHEERYFVPVMITLLSHSLDDNKRVQHAAISSFCFFQEEAKLKLIPFVELISQAFIKGFEIYKMRSLYLLYDAIGVLALSIGAEFKKIFNLLAPPLLHRFNSFYDMQMAEEFLAICDCLSSIVTAVDVDFLPHTEVVYHKCCSIICDIIHGDSNCDFDKELTAGALELLVALACNLKTYFVKFVINSNLMDLLFYIIQDDSIHVRQPGLALLGEIVRLCFPYVSSQIHIYIPAIIENLDRRFNGACNNAAWVIGKLCVAMETGIAPYAGRILEHSIEILQSTDGMQTLYKTVSISLCTLGLICPDEVAPSLKSVMRPICSTIRNVADCEEKELAFRGLCEMILRNPEVFANDFIYFCDAIASWNEINYDLKEKISTLIMAFKNHVGDEAWNKVYGHFPVLLQARMASLYGV